MNGTFDVLLDFNTILIEKVFNFEKAFEGIYTISVQDKENSYYETVIVK